MQDTFDKSPDFSSLHFKVDKVAVVKKSDTAYDGTASIIYKGASHNVPVHIAVSKDPKDTSKELVDWKTDPGTLDFDPPVPATDPDAAQPPQ